MKRITKAGITAAGVLGLLGGASSAAFADTPTPSSGVVNGTVSVANALTLNLQNTSFSVNNAQPGVSFNGVPPIGITVLTNDPGGYALTAYMNDNDNPVLSPCTSDAFWNGPTGTDTGASIPDSSWSVASTGAQATGGTQAFPEQNLVNQHGSSPACVAGGPNAITVGTDHGASASGGDQFTEGLAVTVPGNASGTYTGALTFLATGV